MNPIDGSSTHTVPVDHVPVDHDQAQVRRTDLEWSQKRPARVLTSGRNLWVAKTQVDRLVRSSGQGCAQPDGESGYRKTLHISQNPVFFRDHYERVRLTYKEYICLTWWCSLHRKKEIQDDPGALATPRPFVSIVPSRVFVSC